MSSGRRLLTICGTDTGVGKTVVTASIARAALDAGLSVRVLKPVQTGSGEDDDAAEVDRTRDNSVGADVVVVETAGGAAVQLDGDYDMARLAADLGHDVTIVCRAGLGTLNHTLLTANHLRQRGASVLGLVVSGYPDRPGLAERTNLDELPRVTGLPVIGVIPLLPELTAGGMRPASSWLSPALGGASES